MLIFVLVSLFSCGALPETYELRFPAPPLLRQEILGPPSWHLEWYDAGGTQQEADVSSWARVSLPELWASPILAWPYWPEKDIPPGLFYPAGAIFPFDARGGTVTLSWEAGAAAVFYRELARARNTENPLRTPVYFDWPRFRTLLREEAPEELRADPWLADWKSIAEKTSASGFRKTLLKAETTPMAVPIPHNGPWLAGSPFRPPESWEVGETVQIPVTIRPELFVCPGGVLSVSKEAWMWREFR